MNVKIENSWKLQLQDEFKKEYFAQLTGFIRAEYKTKQIFPPASLIFNAFDTTPFKDVKVVIIGQDPYHNINQAHGLSFSVDNDVRIPPSLLNIYKEINRDMGNPIPSSGNLTHWAQQGVLLLNATLTVVAHNAASHQGKGWETFTDAAIRKLAEEREHLVFLLWGNYAQKKASFINANKHLILKAVHPSPLSAHRGFIGCGHFSQTNEYLTSKGLEPIKW